MHLERRGTVEREPRLWIGSTEYKPISLSHDEDDPDVVEFTVEGEIADDAIGAVLTECDIEYKVLGEPGLYAYTTGRQRAHILKLNIRHDVDGITTSGVLRVMGEPTDTLE